MFAGAWSNRAIADCHVAPSTADESLRPWAAGYLSSRHSRLGSSVWSGRANLFALPSRTMGARFRERQPRSLSRLDAQPRARTWSLVVVEDELCGASGALAAASLGAAAAGAPMQAHPSSSRAPPDLCPSVVTCSPSGFLQLPGRMAPIP
jgi:hypothetical protein